LAAEVGLRISSQQSAYCYSASNIFDCVVLVASVTAMIVYFTGTSLFQVIEEGLALALLVFRYCISFLRVVILVKNQGKYLKTQIEDVVDLSKVGPHTHHQDIEMNNTINIEELDKENNSEEVTSLEEHQSSDEKEFGDD